MKQTIKCLVAAFAAMLMYVSAFAQVTTSALGGRIVDANGEPIIGAAVVATHEPSGTVYGVVTNNDGRYAINGMRSGGPYKVEISCLGYQSLTYTDVNLQLAETSALNGSLKEDAQMLGEAMVIAAPASKFSAEKMGSATNISAKQMATIPTVSRSIDDITRLSPYGGNGMTFAGADGRSSNFTVDGANFNNNFGLNEGLPGGGSPISIDALEEMQVVISPYDVRQTNFIGGGVNAITKSGTNTFKGSAYIYHKNENMRGNMVAGQEVSGARDKDRTTTYGATLGGPIIKDKLFFFVNAEYSKKPTVANSWRAAKPGEEMDPDSYISRVTEEDLKNVSEYVMKEYGYDTGSWTDFPADESNVKVLARVDWNINENHKLAARYNFTNNVYYKTPSATSVDGCPASSFARFSKYGMGYANSMYGMNNRVHSASLDLNSRLSDNLSNQLLVTFSQLDDVRSTPSDDMPFIEIRKDDGSAPLPYICLGYELFSWKNAVHNTNVTVKDDLTYYSGNHKLTAGLSYEYQMADNIYIRNGAGYYRYNSLEDFLEKKAPEAVCVTYGYNGVDEPAVRVRFHKVGAYAQDEWNATENFKLTYGLRLEGLFFDNQDIMRNQAVYNLKYMVDGEERHVDTGKWPSASVNILPRVGFSWDIFSNNSLKLRGGTGLFSGRIPLVFFTNMPTNSNMIQNLVALNGTGKNDAYKVDMEKFAGGIMKREELIKFIQTNWPERYPATITPEDGVIGGTEAVAPNFKMPQVWKTSLALDYNIPVSFPFSVGIEGIFNKTINGVYLRDWSLKDVYGFARFNGADNRPIFQDYKQTYIAADGKVTDLPSCYVLENTNRGYGYSGTFTMNMSPVEGLNIVASYTHTASKEISGMPGNKASSVMKGIYATYGPSYPGLSNSNYVTPDRALISLSYSDKGNNHYSIIYEGWRGGYNYQFTTSNDMNGDGYNADLIYIPTVQQVKEKEFRFVSDDDATRFMDFVQSNNYLRKNQGKYAEAYSVYSPWVHRVDLSYKHDFKIRTGNSMNTLQLCVDLKNLLNLFNSSWGVSRVMNTSLNNGQILKYEGMDKEGYPTFSTPSAVSADTPMWQKSISIGQCWYASVGIKYMFN